MDQGANRKPSLMPLTEPVSLTNLERSHVRYGHPLNWRMSALDPPAISSAVRLTVEQIEALLDRYTTGLS